MRLRRGTGIGVLLAGLCLLAACSAPGAESPAPTPEPTPAPTQTQTPEPTPTPEEVKELWGFPIDDTHDAFEVPTGGKLGTVLVTVEQGGELTESEFGGYHYTLSVWSSSDLTTPIQTLEETVPLSWGSNFARVTDASFDGYTDFLYEWGSFSQNWPFSLYVWKEEQGQFVFETSFVGRGVSVDGETQTIRCAVHDTNDSGAYEIYRWEDGELVCIRRIETHCPEFGEETETQLLTVEDRINGKLTEVYRKTFGDLSNEEIYEEAARWDDLSYHGEDIETLWGFPIDDTHDAFEVPTGGKLGTVLVTVEKKEETIGWFPLSISVWEPGNLELPIQTMEVEESDVFHWNDARDVNFDGYADFGYMYAMGVCNQFWHYWIWNEEKGAFVAEPEFDEISLPEFDEETGIISGYARGGFAGLAGMTTFHKWMDGTLTCIRRIETYPRGGEDDPWIVTVTVEEQVDGELETIYQEKFPGDEALLEASKWKDLNYHGE